MAKKRKKRRGSKRKSGSVAANRKKFGSASRKCMKENDTWGAFGKCMKREL